jgi:hypothetical protein
MLAALPGFDPTHTPVKVFITGASGTGKTTEFYRLVLTVKAAYRFVFDRDGEFSVRNRVRPACTREDLLRQTASGFSVWYPGDMFPGDWRAAFSFWCDYVYSVSGELKGRKIACCDEVVSVIEPYRRLPQTGYVMLQNCRKVGLDCYFSAQSPNEAHTSLRNQMTQAITFKHEDPTAMEWLVKKGFDAEQIQALRRGQFLHKNFDTGVMRRGGSAF